MIKFPTSDTAILSERNAILSSMGLKDDPQTEAGVQTLMTQFAKDKDIVPILGYVADRLGDGKEAQRATLYQHIIDTYPQHEMIVRVKAKLAQVRIIQGDEKAAEAILQKVLTDYPSHPRLAEAVALVAEGYWDQAHVAGRNGHAQQAQAFCVRSVELLEMLLHQLPATAGVTPKAHHLAAQAYTRLGRYDAAISHYESLASEWPDYPYSQRVPSIIALLKRQRDNPVAVRGFNAEDAKPGNTQTGEGGTK